LLMKIIKYFHSFRWNKNVLTVVLVFTLTTMSACSFLPKEEPALAPPLVEPAAIEYETAEVTRGPIIKRVSGIGNLTPAEKMNLSYSQSGGRVQEVHVKEGDQVKEGQVLVEVETGNLPFDIEQTQLELEKAKLRLSQAKEQNADSYSIKIAELDVKGVQVRLYQLNRQMANSQIVSPVNGFVTFVGEKNRGDVIGAYEHLIQVADPQSLQIIYTAISASDLSDVKLGMPVNITFAGTELKGEVVQTPSNVPGELFEKNPDLYQRSIVIDMEKLPEEAKVGDSADIEIITQQKEDTLVIPRSALRSSMGRDYVQILTDETKKEVDIEKGIVSATEVEVLKGLEEGDKVILK
jgi:macrolide-specific efflux system membrane fusion protein